MATYEIGKDSASTIWYALRFYQEHCDPVPDELIELFAPPEPPTAAELAEALRTALARDYPQAERDALDVLRRWDGAQS